MALRYRGEHTCPRHGSFNVAYCPVCRARDYKERVDKGLIVNNLNRGDGREESDPSPEEIRRRAARVRRMRDSEDEIDGR